MAQQARRLSLLLAIVFLAQCYTLQDEAKAWVGHSKQDLIGAWGLPRSVTSDRQGGSALHYVRQDGNHTFHVTLYADKNGQIYDWRWVGE